MHDPNLQGAIASLTLQGDAHTLPASSPNEQETQLSPFQLDVVKHLATLSVLARLWPKSLHSKSQVPTVPMLMQIIQCMILL
jgi:hypothetical protein